MGAAPPGWAANLPEVTVVDPGSVEFGLNALLARTRAPLLLPVQSNDDLDPSAVAQLARALHGAPGSFVCAAGTVDQVRRDGTIRRVEAAPLAGSRAVLEALHLPGPVLFRTAALRTAGGWRQGDACWEHRSRRHRALLARLLCRGALLPAGVHLGTVARVAPDCGRDLPAALRDLLLKHVTVEGPGFRVSGRLAALSPHLATVVAGTAPVTLIPLERITAVQAGEPNRLS
ncbi:MAG TPA: hypothetical protein VNT75_06210 [Symbiobacteriaceae bacterium]|nr:hypothetical protein [Symbiobacteriaceae bacterium]